MLKPRTRKPRRCFTCKCERLRFVGVSGDLGDEGEYDLYECEECGGLNGVPHDGNE